MFKLIILTYLGLQFLNFSNCLSNDNSNITLNKIINGDPVTSLEEAKYFVSIARKPSEWETLICGGTVIDANRILTAAHCFLENGVWIEPSTIEIIWGALTRSDIINGKTSIFQISKIIHHKKYNNETIENDIALVILSKPLNESHMAAGGASIPQNRPKSGDICTTMGFGYTQQGGPFISHELNKVDVQVLSNKECKKIKEYFTLARTALCAGNQRDIADSCQGDSGGPMFCDGHYVSGIVSYGYYCGSYKYPSVYTDVSAYRDWIARNFASTVYICNPLILNYGAFKIFNFIS